MLQPLLLGGWQRRSTNSFLYVVLLSNKIGASNKVQVVDIEVLGIRGNKSRSASTSVAGGNVPGRVGPSDGAPSGSEIRKRVHFA